MVIVKYNEQELNAKFNEIKEKVNVGVITHAGKFHADDVFAMGLLEIVFNKTFDVIRVNNGEEIPKDYKGLVFDIDGGEFDHHLEPKELYQSKNKNREIMNLVPMAALGKLARILIPVRYGMNVYQGIVPFFMDIEETDNTGKVARLKQKNPLNLIIKDFNPSWDEEISEDEAFRNAVEFAKLILNRKINNEISEGNAKDVIKKAIDQSKNSLIVLDKYLPWQEHTKGTNIFYAVFPSRGEWTLGVRGRNLPSTWLKEKPEGCTFVHASLFMASFKTKEDVINAYEKELM